MRLGHRRLGIARFEWHLELSKAEENADRYYDGADCTDEEEDEFSVKKVTEILSNAEHAKQLRACADAHDKTYAETAKRLREHADRLDRSK